MMNRVVIEDQENRLVNVLHQSLEETKKRIGVHVALNGLKAKLAARRDGRDQIDAEATARITDDRSFTPGCPGGATVIIRPNAGFIAEIDGGADFFLLPCEFPGRSLLSIVSRPLAFAGRPDAGVSEASAPGFEADDRPRHRLTGR